MTVLVGREGRIAIGHAGVVDPLVFEAAINGARRRRACSCFAHRGEFIPTTLVLGSLV
jgi:hypothetical protein